MFLPSFPGFRPPQGLRLSAVRACLWVALLGLIPPGWSGPETKVRVHLKWSHQFQFAGFYAAQQKGYYREEGLAVELIEAGPDRLPLAAVEGGRAEFGVSDSEVFRAYLQGRPLVALGVVFQHSPNVILALRRSGITRPSDLVGRTVMFQGGQGEVEARAMLKSEGVRLGAVHLVQHSWRLEDLLEGKVDALSAYATNEPFLLAAKGGHVVQLRPITYGVDFYGDLLFTTRAYAEAHPEVTTAFARASFKGWEYAMAHPEEMIPTILALPGVRERGLTAEKLRFEAEQMKPLLLPGLVDAGHMNPGRFRAMAEVIQEQEGFQALQPPEGFVHTPPVPFRVALRRGIVVAGPFVLVAMVVVGLWILQLRLTVRRRTRALEAEIRSHRLSELALRESEHRLGEILDSVDAFIFIKDTEYRYTYVNRKVCELFGKPPAEIVGRTDEAFFRQEDLPELLTSDRAVLERGEVVAREEVGIQSGTGGPRTYWAVKIPLRDEQGRIYGMCGHATDITGQRAVEAERRDLQARLHQTQKMESLGSLAGGIAHDMNNVLGAILGIASAHQEAQAEGTPLRNALGTIVTAAERGGTLVKGLLNFARQTPAEPRRLDLNALIREEVRLLERTTLSKVTCEMDLDPDLPPIMGDPSALTHALMNLCVNAVDAMPHSGTLTLRTRNLPEGVVVDVLDTGVGMHPEVLQKAMDPFFTTKEQGKGTGLGLSLVYSTVTAHQGRMEIHSEPGHGTRVSLAFPPAGGVEPTVGEGAEAPSLPAAGMVVLLVDDDELVRTSVRAMLEALGHAVAEVERGEGALAFLAESLEVDAVVLDLNMPGLGGAGTLPRLRALRPTLPVFLATGRADASAQELIAGDPATVLLPKPFSLSDLRRALEGIPAMAPPLRS